MKPRIPKINFNIEYINGQKTYCGWLVEAPYIMVYALDEWEMYEKLSESSKLYQDCLKAGWTEGQIEAWVMMDALIRTEIYNDPYLKIGPPLED